jgi:hypothetical protein
MMGNDRKPNPDVAKARPGAAQAIAAANLVPDHLVDESDEAEDVSASADAGGSSQGHPGPEEPIDFCERVHVLKFQTLPKGTPQVGQAVQLLLAAGPPLVVSATGEHVGELTDRRHSAIWRCLADDYVMVGHVVELEPDRKHGKVRVVGRRE